MVDLAPIDAVLSAGHPDSARIGISVGLLRALEREISQLRAAEAMRGANAGILGVIDSLHKRAIP